MSDEGVMLPEREWLDAGSEQFDAVRSRVCSRDMLSVPDNLYCAPDVTPSFGRSTVIRRSFASSNRFRSESPPGDPNESWLMFCPGSCFLLLIRSRDD